jgi:mono/diheme cytochrome c family protein
MNRPSRWCGPVLAITLTCWIPASAAQTTTDVGTRPRQTGEQLYEAACTACHGPDGKGVPRSVVGFNTPLPDFSDCEFSTSEPDRHWRATIHLGGHARALDRRMPAFGDAFTDDEIDRVIDYVHRFCRDRAWPRGDLNLPRALLTEKAFPENEAFVVSAVPTRYTNRVDTQFVYEHRLGARAQYEVTVPFNVAHAGDTWNRGLGDVAFAFKHAVFDSPRSGSLFAAGGEMTFPTGKEREFLGNRLTILEPFGTFSQLLPHESFVHAHVGFEMPINIPTENNELFWRVATGKTFAQGRWGRAWSPMVEVLGDREMAFDEPVLWDVLPQLQVTLSRRQHVRMTAGVRVPVNLRPRSSTALVSLLWDWYEGSLFSGW